MPPTWKNKLYFGDNLSVLRDHVADESVDLVYLDPPFNSAATYNVLFKERSGQESSAQITAFEDTWHWGLEAEAMYHGVVTSGGRLADLLQAFRTFLGPSDMMAYLTMMAPRLVELERVLKPSGSVYLHCDPTASHYLKLLMDAIFGPALFRNEIIWKRTTSHGNVSRAFGDVTDTIFYYSKGDEPTWNQLYVPYTEKHIESKFANTDKSGRHFTTENLRNPGVRPNLHYPYTASNGVTYQPHPNGWAVSRERMEEYDSLGRLYFPKKLGGRLRLKRYLDEQPGKHLQNLWEDIFPLNSQAQERLGYPTQKPEALLERILKASSNEGDLVLDPFCGCGTTVSVAEKLNRRWIGVDITHLAISLIRHRLQTAFGPDLAPYEVLGAPTDAAGAAALALEDRHQFEWWALGLVEARPAQDKKKGADSGLDGLIYFFDDTSGQAKKIVVQVKSGHPSVTQIRDLARVIEREKAALGVFVTLEDPTGPMNKEAASVGFYEPEHFNRKKFPRLQILTIAELLAGKDVQYPRVAPAATFKVAEPQVKTDLRKGKKLL